VEYPDGDGLGKSNCGLTHSHSYLPIPGEVKMQKFSAEIKQIKKVDPLV
jgi:hypothetical protein